MATALSCTFEGRLMYPPDDGGAPAPVTFGVSVTFQASVDLRLVLSGAGSYAVPFGSITGVKQLLIEYENETDAAPVQLQFSGGAGDLSLSPGGFLALGSPGSTPAATSLTIVHTTSATIRVRLFA